VKKLKISFDYFYAFLYNRIVPELVLVLSGLVFFEPVLFRPFPFWTYYFWFGLDFPGLDFPHLSLTPRPTGAQQDLKEIKKGNQFAESKEIEKKATVEKFLLFSQNWISLKKSQSNGGRGEGERESDVC
jgi:hypothetical protein